MICECHNKSKGLSIDAVSEDGELRWKIANTDGISYTVIKQADYCMDSTCQIKCEECKICIHQFICNCPGSLIHNPTCKHVHLSQRYLTAMENQAQEIPGDLTVPQYADPDYKEREVKLVTFHLQQRDNTKDNLTRTLKEATKQQLLMIVTIMRC